MGIYWPKRVGTLFIGYTLNEPRNCHINIFIIERYKD